MINNGPGYAQKEGLIAVAYLIAVVVFFAVSAVLVYRGHQVIKLRESLLHKAAKAGGPVEQLAYVSYHGGFPEIPTPQKLVIAASREHLFLVTNKGEVGKSSFAYWNKLEKFTSLKKQDYKQQVSFLWNPLCFIQNEKKRHFLVIHYSDSRNQDSYMLFEHNDPNKMNGIFDSLKRKFDKRSIDEKRRRLNHG